MPDGLVVRAGDPSLVGEAQGLGERLGAPVVDAVPTSDERVSLVVSADGLCLRRGNMSLSADLT